MNENYRNNYDDGMEINVTDLMFYLLKQWKALLLVVVLGLLLGGSIWKLKSISSHKGLQADETLKNTADVIVEQAEMSPGAIQGMDLAYRYRQLYWGQLDYNLNSVLMKLDPNKVYKGTLKYYISAEDNTEFVGLLYQNMILKQDFIHKVKENTSIECEDKYIGELMDCTLSRNANTIVNIENADDVLRGIEVTYSIVYSDEEICEKVLDIIGEENEILRRECQEKYGEYIQKMVFNEVQLTADSGCLDKQKKNTNMMNEWLNEAIRVETGFTDEERIYYEEVYLGILNHVEEEIEGLEATEENVQDSMMKWLLIGIMLGIVCWGGYYFVKYLLDKRIKYAEELSNYYGLHLIGRYKLDGKESKGIDKIQEQMVNRNAGGYSSKEYIVSVMKMLDKNSLLLIGDRKDGEVAALIEEIGERCPKVECGDLMQNDSGTLERVKERANIVLCVRKGKSTHTEIRRELEICSLQNVCVVGAIVME